MLELKYGKKVTIKVGDEGFNRTMLELKLILLILQLSNVNALIAPCWN